MSRASRLKVTGADSHRFTNSPITRVHVKPSCGGRTAGSGFLVGGINKCETRSVNGFMSPL